MDYIKWLRDMHRQCEDSCRNLMSTQSPSQTMDQNRYGFLPRWFRTEIFNRCRLFLQVSVHLPCCIDSPPKDTEIPARPVFDQRRTSRRHDRQQTTLQWWRIPMLRERIRLQAPDILTTLPSIKWIHRGDGQESQSRIQEKWTDLRMLKREPYYSYATPQSRKIYHPRQKSCMDSPHKELSCPNDTDPSTSKKSATDF